MFNITRPPMYDVDAVQPMRDELIAVGFTELRTTEEVEKAIIVNDNETKLVFINSVCGCAAGAARPAVSLALQNSIIPNKIYTVFAGQDRDAVDKVRELIKNYPPSSPSIALFKNGELVFFLPRFGIEGYSAQQIASVLVEEFNNNCNGKGPSVSPEVFANVRQAVACGSKIPLYKDSSN